MMKMLHDPFGIFLRAILLFVALGWRISPLAAEETVVAATQGAATPELALPQAPARDAVLVQQEKLKLYCPATAAKCIAQRRQMEQESLEECLDRLADLSFYLQSVSEHPSITLEWPLDDGIGRWEMRQVVTNRRLSKIITEIAVSKRSDAGVLVSSQIEKALAAYRGLSGPLLADPAAARSAALSRDTSVLDAPSNAIAEENGPNGAPVLKGVRLELFSLAFVVGYLHLADASEAMLTLAHHAKAQRDILYLYRADAGVPPFDPSKPVSVRKGGPVVLLHCYGLYNRIALASGLLGCLDADTRIAYLNSVETVEYPMGSALSVVTPYESGGDVIGVSPSETVQVEFLCEIPDIEVDRLIDLVAKRLAQKASP